MGMAHTKNVKMAKTEQIKQLLIIRTSEKIYSIYKVEKPKCKPIKLFTNCW